MAKVETDIYNYVKALLEAAQATGQPLDYVKAVFEGTRENIMELEIPCISLELGDIEESNDRIPTGQRTKFNILVICQISVLDLDQQITSTDAAKPGLLRFISDVKNTLEADRTLGGNCGFFHFPRTTPELLEFPYRQMTIRMEVDFLGKKNERPGS